MANLDISALTPERRAMGSFCILPDSKYIHQEEDEQLILLLRAHPITQLMWIANTVFAVIFHVFILGWLGSLIGQGLWTILFVFGFFLIFAYAWYNFILWYYNLGLVTNKRIVDIDYFGISKRVTTEARIAKIADATAKVRGFFGQIFNYGEITVKTDGPIQNIEYDDVPDPELAVSIINALVGQAVR
ncbi:MAG: hypothetical protein WCJ70_04040 [bacterium]